jgi:hypothetical protein
MTMIGARRFATLAVFSLLCLQGSPASAQTRIGAASTASNRVEGLVGNDTRPITVGTEVYQNERVRTGLASDAKLIFLDDTNLSVGPSSEVALDRFVYDPDKNAGAVVVRTNRGLFRFITGSQKPQNYVIATPLATIGVRGTIFDLLVAPDRVTVLLHEGQVLVTTLAGQTVTLSQVGTSVTIFLNGNVVGPTVWTGSVYVDFASANFPYFPPVTSSTRRASIKLPIRTAKPEVDEPRRHRRPGYRLTSHEQEVEVRKPHRPRHERPTHEAKTYPKKTYPKPSSSSRRTRHY